MTLITAVLAASGLVSISIFIAFNAIQGSIYDASFRVVLATEAFGEKLDEIDSTLSSILERLGGEFTLEERFRAAGL
jgi:hypothetical protein